MKAQKGDVVEFDTPEGKARQKVRNASTNCVWVPYGCLMQENVRVVTYSELYEELKSEVLEFLNNADISSEYDMLTARDRFGRLVAV